MVLRFLLTLPARFAFENNLIFLNTNRIFFAVQMPEAVSCIAGQQTAAQDDYDFDRGQSTIGITALPGGRDACLQKQISILAGSFDRAEASKDEAGGRKG
jgi:hypothetical protein